MKYIELQNASSFKLDKMLFNFDMIECIQKPTSNDIGCIVIVQGQKYPVKESYDEVKDLLIKLS